MGSYGGPAQGPRGAEFKLDTSFQYIYRQNEEEKIFIVVQLLFSELFVPQVFSNRAGPELRWPANTCATPLFWIEKPLHPPILAHCAGASYTWPAIIHW